MDEETPSRELLENLVERIDRLERILQTQTARLYAVEQRLGFEPRPRPRALGIEDAAREESARRAPAPDANASATQTPREARAQNGDAAATGTGARPFEPRATGARPSTPPPPRDAQPGGAA